MSTHQEKYLVLSDFVHQKAEKDDHHDRNNDDARYYPGAQWRFQYVNVELGIVRAVDVCESARVQAGVARFCVGDAELRGYVISIGRVCDAFFHRHVVL